MLEGRAVEERGGAAEASFFPAISAKHTASAFFGPAAQNLLKWANKLLDHIGPEIQLVVLRAGPGAILCNSPQ